MQYIKGQIIKRTVLASLFAAISPTVWLKLTKIIGEIKLPPCVNESSSTTNQQTTHG